MASAVPAAAIEARLRANWTGTAIFVGNEIDDIPLSADGQQLPCIILEFPGGAAEQASIGAPGGNLWRETGAFMIHVMVPRSEGSARARGIADDVAAIFRGQEFDGVECWAPFPPAESRMADGAYWGVSFGTPYQFDLTA